MDSVITGIHEFFSTDGPKDYGVYVSQFPWDATGYIHYYAKSLPKDTALRVYAVGGDGILFDCLNGVMDLPNVELGVLPYGQTNNFIRGFGKKVKPLFRDISLQFNSSTVPLDVIRVGSNYAFSFCIIGTEARALLYARKIQDDMGEGSRFSRWMKRSVYNSIYVAAALAACLNAKTLRQRYEINLDGEDLSGGYRGINIANSPFYAGGLCPVRGAMPNDGVMDILFARQGGRLRSIAEIPWYLRAKYNKSGDFFLRRGRKIHIRSNEPILIGLDDIIFSTGELTVELIPSAVKFVDVTRQGYRGTFANE
jgi:diacylglycerol kinase family enzyme